MTTISVQQQRAINAVCDALLEAIAGAGAQGVPGGTLYAALMTQGCRLAQFESLMGSLERLGKVRKSGDVYHIVP